MADLPGSGFLQQKNVVTTAGIHSQIGQHAGFTGSGFTSAAAWPVSNTAIYCPILIESPCTVYQMSFLVGTQSGNFDIGIYDFAGKRLVSKGSTTVPVSGLALVDITDTDLLPGAYFFALNCDNVTVTINRVATFSAQLLRTCGVQAQAVGAVTLPNPATFANPSSGYAPLIAAHLLATV